MTKDNRQFPRKEIQIEVELNFMDDSRTVMTHNASLGGLFLLVKDADHFTMGELVNLHYKNPFENYAATEKDGIIVRHAENGIAVAFVEMEEF